MSGPPNANLDQARRWLRQAEENLATARWNAQGKFWAPACFYAEQSGETALKAVLIAQGERSLFTHSVRKLAEQAAGYHPELTNLVGKARRLDRYYIATRYPNGLAEGTGGENFDETDFQEADAAAGEIVSAARKLIPATA
jgi:HEPN domain-containing protein